MEDRIQERLYAILESFQGRRHELIPLLQRVQQEFGYLPEQPMREIARFAGVPESRVYAVATFYSQFRFTPIGRKHIVVCRGTACHVSGAPRILEEIETHIGVHAGETTEDLEYSLETVACIGACSLAPCVVVNNEVEGNMTPQKVADLFPKKGEKDAES